MTLATHSTPRPGRKQKVVDDIVHGDLNLAAAALLYDMAALQPTERSQFGYKRAAKALVNLPADVSELVAAGVLRDVPFIGPSSTRIISELVESGQSATVAAALAKSAAPAKVLQLRSYREGYLSHFAMQKALAASLGSGLVEVAAYRGDFQTHSTWSDGSVSIAEMADAAAARGHSCLGITDHSYGLPIARGMSMENVLRQHREIDELNRRLGEGFRVYKGIEANILADGSLDVQPGERASFDFIVASPHSQLRKADDQTERMLAAVRGQGVSILGHPRGRMFNGRGGVIADWDRVFAEAAARRVAVELDGNWHRQDLDFVLARRAMAAGCLFALDSDAHAPAELRFSDYAVAHARLAFIPATRVINCWSRTDLQSWMRQRAGEVR